MKKKISIPAKAAGLFIVAVLACIVTIVLSTNDDLTFGAMAALVIVALAMSSTTIREEDRIPLAKEPDYYIRHGQPTKVNTYHKYLKHVDTESEHEQ